VSDAIRACIGDRVFTLQIEKYPDDKVGDLGVILQKAKCRVFSTDVNAICNTNVS